MKTVVAWIQAFASAIGGPGLFIIAFLDSSFLSFPQVADLLVFSSVLDHPYWMVYYASLATLGSVLGCLSIYQLARKGGEAFIRRRFDGPMLTHATRLSQRYGVLSIVIPALLPPPAPFKIFVLLAGVSGMRPLPFAMSIAVGRGLRYFAIGLLTVWYGAAAKDYLLAHEGVVAYWVVGLAVAGLLFVLARYYFVRSRRSALTSVSEADIMP